MRVVSRSPDLPQVGLSTAVAVSLLIAAGFAIALLPLTYSAALTLALVTSALILVRVEYGVYLAIFSIPFGSLKEIPIGPASLTATEFIVPLVFAGWVFGLVARREARVRFTFVFPVLVLFLGTLVLSSTFAKSLSLSAKELLKWAEFSVLFLVVANVMTTRRKVAVVVGLLLLATSLEALHGWHQFLFRQGPESFLIGGRFLRAFGTFGQPNPYAAYLGLTLPLLLGLLIGARWNMSLRVDWGIVALVAGALMILVALLMSFSRGALLGLSLAVAAIFALRDRRSLILLLAGVVVGTAVALAGALDLLPPQLAERLAMVTQYFGVFDVRKVNLTPENWAIVERMAYWQSAWSMFNDYPILGVGTGNFGAFYPDYAFPGWQTGALGHAHNYYLNLLAEAGLLGLITYLSFWLAVLVLALRTVRELREIPVASPKGWTWFSQPYPLALGIVGVLVALSAHSFFDVLYVHGMAAQLGLLLGLLVALQPPGEEGVYHQAG